MDHPGDKIPANSTIEIKTNLKPENKTNFIEIGRFNDYGVTDGQLNYGAVEQVQIKISKKVDNWILISEIVFA